MSNTEIKQTVYEAGFLGCTSHHFKYFVNLDKAKKYILHNYEGLAFDFYNEITINKERQNFTEKLNNSTDKGFWWSMPYVDGINLVIRALELDLEVTPGDRVYKLTVSGPEDLSYKRYYFKNWGDRQDKLDELVKELELSYEPISPTYDPTPPRMPWKKGIPTSDKIGDSNNIYTYDEVYEVI